MKLSSRALAVLLAIVFSAKASASPAILPFMPNPTDFSLLWWAHGPQDYREIKAVPPPAILCLQSGQIGVAIDTQKLLLLHLGTFAQPMNVDAALRLGNDGLSALSLVPMQISLSTGGKLFTCTGRAPMPRDEFFFPVRFVESGHFLQHVTIEDLEFADAGGKPLGSKGRLEIALWPDRLIVSAELPVGDGELTLRIGPQQAKVTLGVERRATLALFAPEKSPMPIITPADADVRVEQDSTLGCQVVHLPRRPWKNSKNTYYPSDELDRLDRWHFTLENRGDHETVAPILFEDDHTAAITGVTPMLCDADGTPTGIPVQLSKDWHTRPEKGAVVNQGTWFHACTFVHLPPGAKREFVFQLAYARYGGVPAASHAQLSLVGWGHNQFWDQSAIGSFGESICYEPGRVQRRCFIDDVRPLMTLSNPTEKPNSWASNCGGGDFLMWVDPAGNYQGFEQTRANYIAHGPCLTHAQYVERTIGGEISARMDASIARSDDYLRAFHHIHYEVKKSVAWQRLAFYQLGSDFYNETPADKIAIGDGEGLAEEWESPHALNQYDRRSVRLAGKTPWVSFHGVDRSRLRPGAAAANRGLIVRGWKARLGGRDVQSPSVSTYCTEWGKGNFRTVIELSPPGDVKELQPGDFVDAELEMVVFPADPASYYGPNVGFAEALKKDADSWKLVSREATGNALEITPANGTVEHAYPIAVAVDKNQHADFKISHGVGFVPLTFTGLNDYENYDLRLDGKAFDQTIHGRDFWQTDFDLNTRAWEMTFNIPRDGQGPTRVEFGPRGK